MSKADVIITAVFTGIGVVVALLSILLPVLFGIAGDIGDLRERVARVETRLEYIETRLEYALPRPPNAVPEQLP